MDFTTIPQSLVYKERGRLRDFGVPVGNELNITIYDVLVRYLKVSLGDNNYSKLLLALFNEAYRLCTLFLLDTDAVLHYSNYINSILYNYTLPDEYRETFKKMVCAICYVYLEDISVGSDDITTIRRHLRSASYEYMPQMSETTGLKRPDWSDFKSVELTDELLSIIDWAKTTDNYEMIKTESILRLLGKNSFEKKRLVEAIFTSILASGNLYQIPYRMDGLLYDTYIKYGGNRKDFLDMGKRKDEYQEASWKKELAQLRQWHDDWIQSENELREENERLRQSQEKWRESEEYLAEKQKWEKSSKNSIKVEVIKRGLLTLAANYIGTGEQLNNLILNINQILRGTAWETESGTILGEVKAAFNNTLPKQVGDTYIEHQTVIPNVEHYYDKVQTVENKFPSLPPMDDPTKMIE